MLGNRVTEHFLKFVLKFLEANAFDQGKTFLVFAKEAVLFFLDKLRAGKGK